MMSRIIRDFVQRRSIVLVTGSALYLVFSLLAYSLAGHDGFGFFLLAFAILFVCLIAGVLYFDNHSGLPRVLFHLPVDRSALAKTYWAMAVGVPTAWVLGLTLIAWLATSAGGRVAWFSVPIAVALSFLMASFVFCMEALENSRRKFGGESAPRWAQVAMVTLVVLAALAGGFVFLRSFDFFLSMDFWQVKHLLALLALGAAASTLGWARTRALLRARKARPRLRLAGPGLAILKRPLMLRNLSGFAAITVSCLWIPAAIAAGLATFFAFDMGARYLLGLNQSHPHMELSGDPGAAALVLACFIVCGFAATYSRFANPRMLLGLPVSARKLSAFVTLLPATLVLLQVALAFPLLYVLDRTAAMTLFLPLAGAVGIAALICPAILVRPQGAVTGLLATAAIVILICLWLVVSVRVPALQPAAVLVFAGGLIVSWALTWLVFRYALDSVTKPLPVQRVAPLGND